MDTYTLTHTEAGLTLVLNLTLSLRACGYTTRVTETTLCGFPVYVLAATPATHLSRRERGL